MTFVLVEMRGSGEYVAPDVSIALISEGEACVCSRLHWSS